MAWIESHQELANHPKTKRFKRALGISTPQAIGHLHLLWWWALDYAQDGSLAAFSPDDLAEAAEYEGEGERFVDALVKSGFVDEDGMTIHDWDDYGSKFLKRREQSRIRQQRYRDEHGRYQNATNASVTRDKRSSNTVTGQDKTGQERKRTGDKPPKPPVANDPPLALVVDNAPKPWELWDAFGEAADYDLAQATPKEKGLALKAAKRMVDAGISVADVAGCTRYLVSQSWRTGILSMTVVEREMGKWLMAGRPEREPPRRGQGGEYTSAALVAEGLDLMRQGR